MKDKPNFMNNAENKTTIADSIPNISMLNNNENTIPVSNISNKDNKSSRFPIAENNIIGFK